MPRPNRARSIASEANLAQRFAYERESRGLSYEGFASLMTERGCAMHGSAIYKIEKGDPPRRVTVDELVALSRVLDVSLDELLMPMEVIEKRQAKERIDALGRATEAVSEAVIRTYNVFSDLLELEDRNPELREYVDNQWGAASKSEYPVVVLTGDRKTADMRLHELLQKVSDEIAALATENVTRALASGAPIPEAVKGRAG